MGVPPSRSTPARNTGENRPDNSLTLQVYLTEEEIHDDFLRALKACRLSERFFYWLPLSVASWIRLCSSPRYKNFFRSLALCEKLAPSFPGSRLQAGTPVQWISLGCGQGTKEAPFLQRALQKGLSMEYIPWDSSQMLLEMACLRALDLTVPTLGFKADLENPDHWQKLPPPKSDQVRVVSIFGNSLGAIGLTRFFHAIQKLLRPGDWFLLDGELYKGKETLAGYTHPANQAFAFAPLKSVGLTESDGTLRFTLHPPFESPVGEIRKAFVFKRDTAVRLSGHRMRFRKGQVLRMSPSEKYDLAALSRFLTQGRRFRIEEILFSPDRRFALWLARRR